MALGCARVQDSRSRNLRTRVISLPSTVSYARQTFSLARIRSLAPLMDPSTRRTNPKVLVVVVNPIFSGIAVEWLRAAVNVGTLEEGVHSTLPVDISGQK